MNSYTDAELKFFQSQIRSMNFLKGKLEKRGKIGDTAGAILDDFIAYEFMTEKGFAKYSMSVLKGMTEEQIEAYIENIDKANDLLNLIRSSEDIVKVIEGKGGLSDPEGTIWRIYSNLKDSGTELDSDLVKELVDASMDGRMTNDQLQAHILNMLETSWDPNKGLAGFEEEFNKIGGLRVYYE